MCSCVPSSRTERECVCVKEKVRERERGKGPVTHTTLFHPIFLYSPPTLPLSLSPLSSSRFLRVVVVGRRRRGGAVRVHVCVSACGQVRVRVRVCVCVPFCAFNSRRKISFPSLLLCVSVSFSSRVYCYPDMCQLFGGAATSQDRRESCPVGVAI